MSAIETERLLLRPPRRSDADATALLAGNWDVARMTTRIPYPYTREDAVEWIETCLAPDAQEMVFVITLDDVLIGCCGLQLTSDDGTFIDTAELGYWLGKPYWGNGYATEAGAALLRMAFEEMGLRHVTCGHFSDNLSSRRVIEKLGFAFVGAAELNSVARRGRALARQYDMKAGDARRKAWYDGPGKRSA